MAILKLVLSGVLLMATDSICPRCGKRQVPFTMGDGVPVCDCDEKVEHDEKYIYFNRKYWKVEDLELEVVDND